MDRISKNTSNEFWKDFKAELTVNSPGRINMIGEHTDYNNGFVFPAAIDKSIQLSFQKNETENECFIYSENYDKLAHFDIKKISRSDQSWENYLLGVLEGIQQLNKSLKGFNCVIKSNLPVGAGISSSAALECGFAYGLNELFHLNLSKEQIITLSREAEHRYVGTNCGIMDQFTSVMGKKDHLIQLDCKTLSYKYVPANFGEYEVVLLNTNVSHNLADSEYNNRRSECETAIEVIQKKYPEKDSLREVDLKTLAEFKPHLSEKIFKRSTYIINENARVIEAAKTLEEENLHAFGELIYASHHGLQHFYEVSCKELDFLVDFSRTYPQVIGSRMMGGGFGGCTINLVHKDFAKEYIQLSKEAYQKEFDILLEDIPVHISQGTSLVNL